MVSTLGTGGHAAAWRGRLRVHGDLSIARASSRRRRGGPADLECRGKEMKLGGAGRVGNPGQQRAGGEPPGVEAVTLVIQIERSRAR